MLLIAAVVLLVLVLAALHVRDRGRILLRPDETETRLAILARVPVGTPMLTARAVMQKSAFRCELRHNAAFAHRNEVTGQVETFEGQTFLYCDREKVIWWKFRNHRWQVILLVPDDTVKDVIVSFAIVAP